MLEDLPFTIRSLRRQPAFTLAAVATLAVGIGATTAIFSTVNAALLRPLPYPQSEDLRILGTAMTDGRITTGRVSLLELARLNNPALSIVKAAPATVPFNGTIISNAGNPVPALYSMVGEGFFDVFGLPMAAGRAFNHDEHSVTGGGGNGPPPSMVISYRLWRDMFGRDPNLIGKTIRLLEFTNPVRIVGVAAPQLDTPKGVDLWTNLRLDMRAAATGSGGSQAHSFDGYLRLRPGTTPERLKNELAGVMTGLAREFPVADSFRVYTPRTLVEAIVGDLGATLILVLCASALLLVLACVNVTNLLLARGAVRTREMALRIALGASRGRIIRQLLTESLVLAAAGALAGLFVAWAGIRLLLALNPSKLPRLDAVPFDSHVLLFALGAMLVSGVLVGLVPALRLAATDIRSLINDGGRSATGSRRQHRILAVLIVAEIALSLVLVAGAGLLRRSFENQQSTDPGFLSQGRLAIDVSVPFTKYNDPAKVTAWSREVGDKLRAIGGVTSVASSAMFPLHAGHNTGGVQYAAFPEKLDDPDHPRPAVPISVSLGYFDTMGIRMVSGRQFNQDDRRGATAVAIVNRTFVRKYLAGRDPLKQRFAFGYPTIDARSMQTIVGVVEDVKYGVLSEEPQPIFYRPQDQAPYWQQTLVVSTSLSAPTTITASVRAGIKSVDPLLLVQVQSVSEIVSESLSRQRLGMLLMTIFAFAALSLAAIGIYGVIAYASSQRAGEVATRMALGATRPSIFWLMMNQGTALWVAGTVAGLSAAYAAGRIVSSQLYEVRASDPLVLILAVALVTAVTFVAIVLPARRASQTSPASVLRLE